MLVVSQQATQTHLADYFAQGLIHLHQGRLGPAQRTVIQTVMRTIVMVMAQILGRGRCAASDEGRRCRAPVNPFAESFGVRKEPQTG
jgi:hypothetical protein